MPRGTADPRGTEDDYVDQKEIIRREYFIKRKSMRRIAREFHHTRKTIHKAQYAL
jgi:hypothetical protein